MYFIRILIVLLFIVLNFNHAQASFTVCNQMLDITNIAIGQTDAEGVETKGWWVIAPNRCADIIEGDLTNQFIYIYAIDVKGQTILEGHNQFCVGLKKFYISGIKDCHIRGYSTGLFHEIDTGKAHDWTLFLKDSN